MRRAVAWALPALSALLLCSSALAHPVVIGRYAEIPYGIRPDHPYPTARGDRARTGRLMGTAPRTRPRQVWQRALRNRTPRGPAVDADGHLYLGNRGGLTSLAADGTERWHTRLGHVIAAPSLAPGGDVIVVTSTGRVVEVSPEGVVRRSADLGAPARASALVLDDGSVVVGTIDRRIHRLDANLRPVYTAEIGDGANRSPLTLLRRGGLAVASGRMLWIFGPRGAVLRQVSLAGRATSEPAVADDGTLWVPTVEGVLHAIDPSGRIRSRTELGSRHYDGAAPAVGRDGGVRVPTLGGGLVCVGPTGTVRWTAVPGISFQAPAAIDEADTTLVVDRQGTVRAIDAGGGDRWAIDLGTFTYEAPVLAADGTLYVTTERGSVRAFRAYEAPAAPTGAGAPADAGASAGSGAGAPAGAPAGAGAGAGAGGGAPAGEGAPAGAGAGAGAPAGSDAGAAPGPDTQAPPP